MVDRRGVPPAIRTAGADAVVERTIGWLKGPRRMRAR